MVSHCPTVEGALAAITGERASITASRRVSGGCIANGSCVELITGRKFFVKQSTTLPVTMFRAEAAGLEALRAAQGPRIPEPLAHWGGSGNQFIVMEWIEPGQRSRGFFEKLGRQLARLHRTSTAPEFGFTGDNFIGATPQDNTWTGSWCEFFAERRLGYQIRLAADSGRADHAMVSGVESIMGRLSRLVPEPEAPMLLHGDLWGGNYLCDENGNPALIDPAAYYGHPEADLAMTELFGGYGPRFFHGYNEVSLLDPGYGERRDLYNLYHLLNHLNLFGAGYAGQVRSVIQRYQ